MNIDQVPSMMAGAEPFFYPGNDVGCLLLHGLTASPAEVRWLGQHLAEHGLTVYGPRLAGHGVDHRFLRRLRWQDWYMSALDGYHLLHTGCKHVFVVGFSMGGLLGLLLAAAEDVDGLAALAVPVRLPDGPSLRRTSLLKYIRPYTDQTDRSEFPERLKAEQRRRGEPEYGRVRYNKWATKAVEELLRLQRVVDTNLPGVNVPTLLVYAEQDKTVPLLNRDYIQKRISSTVVETLTVTRSGHVLPQDYDYPEVQEAVAQFILQHTEISLD